MNNVLVTGGYGCIGSETVKWLLRKTNCNVVICSRKVSEDRTARVYYDVEQSRLSTLEADVTDQSAIENILTQNKIDLVIHMAALQTPDCNANRDLGLQINLAGTQNILEAIKNVEHPMSRVVIASSVAVYGPRDWYPEERVPMLSQPRPVNVYGVWKLAAEHLARLFQDDTGIPTICLRPGVLYGPGRDAGLTASPTTAMKCVALGIPYEIPFCSRQDYLFAPDVGAAVGISSTEKFDGYNTFTLPSHTLATEQIVETLKVVAGRMGLAESFQITFGNEEVPFICDLDYQPFVDAFPDVPHTSLEDAVHNTMEVFLRQVELGWLTENDLPV